MDPQSRFLPFIYEIDKPEQIEKWNIFEPSGGITIVAFNGSYLEQLFPSKDEEIEEYELTEEEDIHDYLKRKKSYFECHQKKPFSPLGYYFPFMFDLIKERHTARLQTSTSEPEPEKIHIPKDIKIARKQELRRKKVFEKKPRFDKKLPRKCVRYHQY